MRILFIAARPPLPVRRGDQARLVGWLRCLRGAHDVSVLALQSAGLPSTPFDALADGQLIEHSRHRMLDGIVRGLRHAPLQVGMHSVPAFADALDHTLRAERPDVAVVMLSRMAWTLGHLEAHGVPAVVDLVDSLALNLARRADYETGVLGLPRAALLRREAQRMARWDTAIVSRASASTVVASADRDSIAGGAAAIADRIEVVPFGLDLPPSLPKLDPSKPPIVLLSGNLGYFPTIDAARAFARDVWPRVRQARPDAAWWLAGARPARAVRRLAAREGVRVIADPPDLATIRRQATVAIAPLRAGSGTPIKVLEAMADGVPVVVTRHGRAGLEGIDAQALTVADTADEQTEAILGLLADPESSRAQATAAFAWLRGRHTLEDTARQFESVLRRVTIETA